MEIPPIIPMLTSFEVPIQISIDNILFVFSILAYPDKLQVFDKTGQSLACERAALEQAIRKYQSHQLERLNDGTWVDKTYWSDANQLKNAFRTIYAMGGLVEIDANDILLVVQKDAVFTVFTEEGVFFKPAIRPLTTLCPAHAFNFNTRAGWRKGMSPEAIQQRIYAKGLRYRGYRS